MPSLSLQTHVADKLPQLSAIPVDPRGFKSALRLLINFLIAHDVQATLWLKLPKDEAWWSDVWEYGKQRAGCTVYSLGTQIGSPPNTLAAKLRPIDIAQDADLKREYLCMAVADNFVCTLLAVRIPAEASNSVEKRTLKLYCSTAGPMVMAVAAGIKQIVESSLERQEIPMLPKVQDEQSLKEAVATAVSAEPLAAVPVDSVPNLAGTPASSVSPSFAGSLADPLVSPPFAGSLADPLVDPLAPPLADPLADKTLSLIGHAVLSDWDSLFPSEVLHLAGLPLGDAYLLWQLQFQEELRSQLATSRSAAKPEFSATQFLSDDFLAQAGQELQSPLTTIKTALTLLASPTLKITQRQRYLEMIATACDRQKALINSVVKLLRLQTSAPAAPQALQLADFLPGIVSTYQPIAKEDGIMLAYNVPTSLKEVLSIESDLKEVVIQLIKHGIQTTSKDGRVWVSAVPQGDKSVELTIQTSKTSGTAKSDPVKFFDAFYHQPDSSSDDPGVGLELPLVKQLVNRMGSSILVESTPSRGLAFKILLPTHR
jgi:two-component system, OmpR family, phosphate regulon sensor histidine kinase PhoR